MAAGTATLADSSNLSNSAIFKGRVQSALVETCTAINSEGISSTMPLVLHAARKSFVVQILNPGNFANWLIMFTVLAAADPTTVAAATLAATNYTPVLGQSDAAVNANIPDADISNAISA